LTETETEVGLVQVFGSLLNRTSNFALHLNFVVTLVIATSIFISSIISTVSLLSDQTSSCFNKGPQNGGDTSCPAHCNKLCNTWCPELREGRKLAY
jgi:hypothetical protein